MASASSNAVLFAWRERTRSKHPAPASLKEKTRRRLRPRLPGAEKGAAAAEPAESLEKAG